MANTFTKLIKCECCGYNYRYIMDRKIPKWICSGYSRGIGCKTRYAITEEELLYIIQIYCNRNKIELQPNNRFMKGIINDIIINSKKDSIVVNFKNGENAIYSTKNINV